MDFIKNLDLISPYIKSDSYASILDYLKADDLIIFEDIFKLSLTNVSLFLSFL